MNAKRHEQERQQLGRRLAAFALAFVLVGVSSAAPGAAQSSPVYPLKISANKRHFVDGRNRPVLFHADTGWHLFYKLTKAEAEQYLENRRQKGFNTILVQLLTDGDYYPNRDGDFPLLAADDLSAPNEKFFAHVDWVVRKAGEKGIQLMIAPAWIGCCKGGWREKMKINGTEKCRQFGRYVGARYKSFPNVMWLLGGDRKPEEFFDVVRAMGVGVSETDSNHLRTVHPSPPFSALELYPNEAWLDFNVTYTYSPDNMKVGRRQLHVYHTSRQDYQRTPVMPFVLIESTYEGEHNSPPQQVRRQAYWSVLSGSAGQVMENAPIYFFGDKWRQAMDAPGSRDMSHLYALFARRAWHTLVPDQTRSLVTAGGGTYSSTIDAQAGFDYVTAARAADGSFALVYLPEGNEVTIDLRQLGGKAGKVSASWFDPVSGKYAVVANSPFPNSGTMKFSPPAKNVGGERDFILVLEAAKDSAVPSRPVTLE
ncbi:MAG TPA: glycoside hydrolase family 140 protein [Pyrinomonadaceae bacterium]|nr:glycoside hydrolase family 140 protein [Pyrinomonadaceae bacterium]